MPKKKKGDEKKGSKKLTPEISKPAKKNKKKSK